MLTRGFVFMNQNMGTCLVVIIKHRNCETAKLQCDSKNLRNTEICQSPSVDSHFDPSVRQMGLNGSQIFCFFLFVSALNVVRCTTRPQTVQRSENGWPNAQMIQRRPTTSAHTLKMYAKHESNRLPQGYVHTATSVQSCVWMWSQSQDPELDPSIQ